MTDIPEKISSLPSPFQASAGGINFSELAAEQFSCPNVLRLQNSKTLKLVTVMVQGKPLICDSKTKVLRPLTDSRFSPPYIVYHIQVYRPLDVSSPQDLSGAD